MTLGVVFLILAVTVGGCSSGSPGGRVSESSSSSSSSATTATGAPTSVSSAVAATVTTSTAAPPTTAPSSGKRTASLGAFISGAGGAGVAAEPGGRTLWRLRSGVAMAIDAMRGPWAQVRSPCENSLWVSTSEGRIEPSADIVLDPGHGGAEPGAVGPGGLNEKELNLAVARMTAEALAAQGVNAVLTRTGDYRQSLASRVAVVTSLRPKAFVSIHHNAAPDEAWQKPGTETYYQTGRSVPAERLAASKRLAGLIYEEVVKALAGFSASWVADRDAGTKYRIGDSGDDYYGILRRSAASGVVASLVELAFVTNPSEEALLRTDEVRRAEAGAVARGIVRFLRSEDPGSGFVEPYPRTEPAGGGGGTEGCADPTQ